MPLIKIGEQEFEAIAKQTTRCVKCYKPAKFWGGHVLQGEEEILAGWCSDKCAEDPGFVGHWRQEMGKGQEMRKGQDNP